MRPIHEDEPPTPPDTSDKPDIHSEMQPTKILIYLSSRDVRKHYIMNVRKHWLSGELGRDLLGPVTDDLVVLIAQQ